MKETSGYVYFAECEPGYVKIGYSTDPIRRLVSIRNTCSLLIPPDANLHTLRLIGVTPVNRYREGQIHRDLATHKVIGEWFRLTPASAGSLSAPPNSPKLRESTRKKPALTRHSAPSVSAWQWKCSDAP